MPHDRFPHLLAMGRKLVADRRANEVGWVGIKALLHQQIDMAEVDVTEVKCDFFRFARFVAKAMNLSGHGILHLSGWYMDVQRMVSRGADARDVGGVPLASFTSGVESVLTTAVSRDESAADPRNG